MKVFPLFLCAVCSLFLSMALPKVIVRFTDWIGTLGVLLVFSLLFAYFLAYYDEQLCAETNDANLAESERTVESTQPIAVLPPANAISAVSEHEMNLLEPAVEQTIYKDNEFEQELHAEPPLPSPIPEVNLDLSIETPAELLARAFQLKANKEYSAAADLFNQVLELDPYSDAAPLMILEIAGALQHCNKYQEAIALLSEALDSPSLVSQPGLKRHVSDMMINLQYLQESKRTGGYQT